MNIHTVSTHTLVRHVGSPVWPAFAEGVSVVVY